MDLLLHPDIYIEHITNFFSLNKSAIQLQVNNLFNNKNNRFILSKSLINIIEIGFSKEDLDTIVGPFLTQLINNNALSIKGETSIDTVSVTESMIINYQNSDKEKRALFLNFCLFEKNAGGKIKPNIVIEKVTRPNIEWLLFQLACNNPQTITLRYFDFKNNEQVCKLFKDLFLNMSATADIMIFDRQANLKHSLFNYIDNRTLFYYTSMPKNIVESQDKIKDIKSKFKKAKIFAAKTDQIHERRILIENLIIETDEDFWNLTFDRTTWKVDFVYCSSISKNIKKKISLFRKVNLN